MRAVDRSAADHSAVLQHVLEIHEVAVVHALRVVVHVVEMDDARLVRLHDVLRKEQTLSHVLRDGAGHVVALDGVDGRVLVGVLLLRLFVRAVDEREDFAVSRVLAALEVLHETVLDVLLRHGVCAGFLDLSFDKILNLFHAQRAVMRRSKFLDLLGDALNTGLRKLVGVVNRYVGLAYGRRDFRTLKRSFLAAALYDIHSFSFLAKLFLKW